MTSGPKRPGARKTYTVADHALWREIACQIKPLRPAHKSDEPGQPAPPSAAKPDEPPRQDRPAKPAAQPHRPSVPRRSPAAPALTGIDRRMQRRLIRGAVDIDARLDLHGESIETARVQLQRFLADSRAQGHRLVLVITGKGASPFTSHTLHGTGHFHSPERLGRLRRMVLEWLNEPEFRAHVSGFQPAHPRHGGGGALYVRLRRPRGHGD
ncbi:MAG TPA: Smr/MutS family protein [Aestuariivirgaceae bacterium]|nr:Smr/MutS family protein [Aestuariivirgaceae bacterium]